MVQPAGSEDKQEGFHGGGGGEINGGSQIVRQQMGDDCQAFSGKNRQCRQESLARHHGQEI